MTDLVQPLENNTIRPACDELVFSFDFDVYIYGVYAMKASLKRNSSSLFYITNLLDFNKGEIDCW